MRLTIGVDPDTTNTAVAIYDVDSNRVLVVYSIKQSGNKDRNATLAMIESFTATLMARRDERLPGADDVVAYAVEGQELYKGKNGSKGTKNPRSILWLAPISGAFLAFFKHLFPKATAFFPSPAAWKGQTPKHIHHQRIGKELGWEMEQSGLGANAYCYPVGDTRMEPALLADTPKINKGDWKHLMDAIGLAIFAAKQYKKEQRKGEVLEQRRAKDSDEEGAS